MVYGPDLKPFMLKGFMNPQDYKLKIQNNGHTGKSFYLSNFFCGEVFVSILFHVRRCKIKKINNIYFDSSTILFIYYNAHRYFKHFDNLGIKVLNSCREKA